MYSNVSVSIITLNEEECLERCLESVAWSNDIVILDSFSTDRTSEIAESRDTVRFYRRDFTNFSDQRNFALSAVPFVNEWVLILDADEVCSPELAEEVQRVASEAPREITTYNVMRRTSYKGRVLRHNAMGQAWIGRMVRPTRVKFVGDVHEAVDPLGEQGYLAQELVHFPFSKGVGHWLGRRFEYAALHEGEVAPISLRSNVRRLTDSSPVVRRKAAKSIARQFPAGWFLYLLYSLTISRCFLDGRPGIEYTLLESFSQFVVSCESEGGPHTWTR